MKISMRTAVGIGLFLFVFIVVNFILFGLVNFQEENISKFRTAYFVFIFLFLGAIYFAAGNFDSKTENAVILIAILLLCVSLAHFAGSVKQAQINAAQNQGNYALIQAQSSYYNQYISSLGTLEASIKNDNLAIAQGIEIVRQKLENRTPIIQETIIEIPGEIIYVEEPAETLPPVIYEEEEEEEDDD